MIIDFNDKALEIKDKVKKIEIIGPLDRSYKASLVYLHKKDIDNVSKEEFMFLDREMLLLIAILEDSSCVPLFLDKESTEVMCINSINIVGKLVE